MEHAQRQRWSRLFREECEAKGLVWLEKSWQRPSGLTRGLYIGKPSEHQSRILIFLHGFGNDALFAHVGLFRQLLQAGWSIATCDIDGHGRGNSSILTESDAMSIVEGLISFVEELSPGRHRLHLMGYSMGAGLLLHYGVHSPERVASLTMIAMPLEISSKLPIVSEALSALRTSMHDAIKEYGFYGFIPAFGMFKRVHYPLRLPLDFRASYVEAARRIIKSLNLRDAIRVITFPSLFIGGSEDHLAKISEIHDLQIPIDKLQVYKIDGETHYTTLLSPLCWKRAELFLRGLKSKV